jgi:hypothetical protein
VVPTHRVDARRNYLGVYARNRPISAAGLRLLTDRQLLATAAARVKGDRSAKARINPADINEKAGSDA